MLDRMGGPIPKKIYACIERKSESDSLYRKFSDKPAKVEKNSLAAHKHVIDKIAFLSETKYIFEQ